MSVTLFHPAYNKSLICYKEDFKQILDCIKLMTSLGFIVIEVNLKTSVKTMRCVQLGPPNYVPEFPEIRL